MTLTSKQAAATIAFAAIASAIPMPSAAQASAPPSGQPGSTPQDRFAYPQQLVDIGGRRLHIHCSGTGSPTVVFDTYSGGSAWSWANVQPEVAKRTRACVYDRAGLGFSDPSPRPGTSENAVDDLHKLLTAAGIKPPYVLVGSAYGGMNVQLYAYRFPEEISGLVLVEAGNENATSRYERATAGKLSQSDAMVGERNKQCLLHAQAGFVPGSDILAQCTMLAPPGTGRALAAAQFALTLSPDYWKAVNSERDNQRQSEYQLGEVRKPFGKLPLAVLSRGVSPYAVAGQADGALNKAVEDENKAIQDEVAQLSSRGTHRVVPGASHRIADDKPHQVVRSIHEVLAKLK
jgi:pimeloyl-ACP methyl ester carboxylesterase